MIANITAELGDYDPEEHLVDYVNQFKMLPKQTPRQEEKIAELHKEMRSVPLLGDKKIYFVSISFKI